MSLILASTFAFFAVEERKTNSYGSFVPSKHVMCRNHLSVSISLFETYHKFPNFLKLTLQMKIFKKLQNLRLRFTRRFSSFVLSKDKHDRLVF